MSDTNVKCNILDKTWLIRHPDTLIHLELGKARRLQAAGKLEIIDPVEDSISHTVKTYQTKVMTAQAFGYLARDSYATKKKNKIAWVQDYSKPHGGAEQSNSHVVSVGENLGFDIIGITPSNFNIKILKTADMIIINNFMEFPVEKFNNILSVLYEDRIPYIKYDHDLRELKRVNISKQLFSLSVKNIFISPKHLDKFAEGLGEQIREHSVCLPLSINTNLFKQLKDVKRLHNTVLVPASKKDGVNIERYMELNPKKEYFFIDQPKLQVPKMVKHEIIPFCDLDKMPEIYNTYEEMLHLPFSFWAGERLYFEALLCGCKPIVNDNVGHTSWDINPRKLKKTLEKAPYKFWKEVESSIRRLRHV